MHISCINFRLIRVKLIEHIIQGLFIHAQYSIGFRWGLQRSQPTTQTPCLSCHSLVSFALHLWELFCCNGWTGWYIETSPFSRADIYNMVVYPWFVFFSSRNIKIQDVLFSKLIVAQTTTLVPPSWLIGFINSCW